MTESFRVAGRDLTPIATGYEPHAFVFAVGEITYRVGPLPGDKGYTVQCITSAWHAEAIFETLEDAVEHVNRRHGAPRPAKRRRPQRGT